MPHTQLAGSLTRVERLLLFHRDCAVHGPNLAKSGESRGERKLSSFTGRDEVEKWRRASSQWTSSGSTSSSPPRLSTSSQIEDPLTYQSVQYVREKMKRASIKHYKPFTPKLKEVLYEEDEEHLEEQRIPFTFRSLEDPCWDSMGILGLSSRMSRDSKAKQEAFMMGPAERRESFNAHQM